jgi:hypothetical protein
MRAFGGSNLAFVVIGAALAMSWPATPGQADAADYCASGAAHRAPASAPAGLESAVATAFEVSPEAIHGAAFVRCSKGKLLACWVGANLDCGKANTSRRSVGASAFCSGNPNADSVPMFATGHDTIYDWRCVGARAVAGKIVEPIDAEGYIAANWREIP